MGLRGNQAALLTRGACKWETDLRCIRALKVVFLLCKLPQLDLHAAVILKGTIYVNHLPGVGSSSYIYLYSM